MENLKFAIVSTDVLIIRKNADVIEVALQEVNRPPHYVHINGFIGGIVRPTETGLEAAKRIIKDKTGLDTRNIFLTPLKFYDQVNRDRRGRVISIAYIGIMDKITHEGKNVSWVPLCGVSRLAYDHNEMQKDVLTYMHDHLFITNIALHFMPKEFTIAELKKVFDYLLGKTIDKRNFYKFAEELPIQSTKKVTTEGRGRPAMLYKKLSTNGLFLAK